MLKQRGFTLVELISVVAIIGILAATAVPLYRTLQQRTYGREAVILSKQILEAQVIYFLEHNDFWPPDGGAIDIFHTTAPDDQQISDVSDALKIVIPVGHHLDFHLRTVPAEQAVVTISSHLGKFPLFTNGSDQFVASVTKSGEISFVVPD